MFISLICMIAYQMEPSAKRAVIEAFRKLDRFEVRFEQEIYSDFFDPSRVEGYLLVERPGRMRMEYQKGDKKSFIWDGTTCYEKDMLADTETRTSQKDFLGEPLVQLLLYGSDVDSLFIIDREKDEHGEVYRFQPRGSEPYQIRVIFDKNWLPKSLEIMGEDGEGSKIRFREFNLKPDFSSTAFVVPPAVDRDPQ